MPASDPFVGRAISHYRILRKLGAGGMGVVYEAEDLDLGRHVALKFLPEAFSRDAGRMARFQREAKVLASLNHPNIASIYGLEKADGTQALAMELVEGPTLADRIRSGPILIDEALRIALQIAEALEYAHEHGIVHRDLKPANTKVTSDGTVKVLDFGLAKAVEGDTASGDISDSPTISRMATQAGILLGTAAYMSPEQAKGKPVDRRADIWAFGCVLYEMLTAQMPFQGETITDTLAAVVRAEPDWQKLPAETPARVHVLLERCLRKDPKQRLRDIGDARLSLEETLSGVPEPSSSASNPAATSFWRRALPWAFGVAVAVAVALAVTLALSHSQRKPLAAQTVHLEMPLPRNVTMSPAGSFTLSPDGRQLAFFAAGSDGVQRLWVRPLDSPDARPLPGAETSDPIPPFWSPDSRFIGYDAGGKLEKIDLSGDPPQTLCDLSGQAVGGSWSRNGVIIFGSQSGIMRVSASGGAPTQLTALNPARHETYHVFPDFLPDGRHFLYTRISSPREGNRGIYIGSIDAKPGEQDQKRLLSIDSEAVYVSPSGPGSDSSMGRLLFLRDGALVAQLFDPLRLKLLGEPITVVQQVSNYFGFGLFSASNNGTLIYRAGSNGLYDQLTWYDRQGKVLGTAGKPGFYSWRALSPNGTRAAVSLIPGGRIGQGAIWLVDFSRGTRTRFTFGAHRRADDPIWSPDGKHIYFASNPSGKFDLYEKPANGATDERLLLKSDEDKIPTSVSRDGQFLMYYSTGQKTKYDLWVLPLKTNKNGGAKPFPFLRTTADEWDGHFSPDGHWVAYDSDESGQDEVYVRRFQPNTAEAAPGSGAEWQVSYGGGAEPQWSRDGKELYYLTPNLKVMSVAVSTNPVFQAGTPQFLFQAPRGMHLGNFGDYTVDGKRFLLLAPIQGDNGVPFTVVLNWQADLKK